MSKDRTKSDDGEGFARAYWDAVQDTEQDWHVEIISFVQLERRRGVLRFVHQALEASDEGEQRVICSYSGVWPNASVISLPAFLFQTINKLERCVATSRQAIGWRKPVE